MTDESPASRIFNLNDQIAFARLSSDWNPMHLDRAFARRTQVGALVVHGIHNLAWAANAALLSWPVKVANIRARFLQPLYLNELATVRLRNRTRRQVEFEVVAANTVVARIKLSSEPVRLGAESAQMARSEPTQISQPTNLQFEELANQAGAIVIGDGDVRLLFPALVDSIGLPAVNALLATSHIVGMACPGLHSLFAGLDVSRDPRSDHISTLAYAVRTVDARFRSLKIDVLGSGIVGRLDAFARLAPPLQPGMAELTSRVPGSPFAGQKSLIVGGSRGLGEVTAKIVAAGGGRTVITYKEGEREAEQVSSDIRRAGGQCEILHYDAHLSASEQLQKLGVVDCCYYFATPKIFQRKSALYEPEKLRTFMIFYADGFFDLCTAIAADERRRVVVFYPSTAAIDEGVNATAEYAMAKMAGEILAKYVNKFMPNIHVIYRRLPRILTDQTATIGVADVDNALNVMVPIVYDVQQMARSAPAPA